MPKKTIVAYHGTCWSQPLFPSEDELIANAFADGISPEHSEYGAVYFSENPAVGNFFAGYRHVDPEMQLQVMLEAKITLSKRATLITRTISEVPVISFDGVSYRVPDDRVALHNTMIQQGYQALVVLDDYRFKDASANDIAILDTDCIEIVGVRIKEADVWTDTLSVDEARERFKAWCAGPKKTVVDPFDYEDSLQEELSELSF